MRIVVACIFFAVLSGCASTYKHSTLAEPNAKLIRGKTVLIATPTNGFYESKEYQNSGKMTASAVRAAFARFAASTIISPDCKDISCLERGTRHDYYAVPEILYWEDRATEWSGIPDRMEVKITIFDTNRKEIASAIISGKSKWATFGGDHPQDLLPEPMNKYVESLY
jgi:hypothetical protein